MQPTPRAAVVDQAQGAPPLPAARRLALAGAGWGALFLANPGVLDRDGSLLLAVLGIALWGLAVVRAPGPRPWRARAAEALPAFLGSAGFQAWIWYVTPLGLVCLALVHALFALFAGRLVRALAVHPALRASGLAIALGWWSVEVLRDLVGAPLGLVWLRLGDFAHHHGWLAGSARVVGPEGLGLGVAVAGGALAVLLRPGGAGGRARRAALLTAGGTLASLAVAGRLSRPPAVESGPLVLLVQPGFPQERKRFDEPWKNFLASRDLTLDALAQAGEPPDLVAWGESMLYVPLTEGLREAVQRGAQTPPWGERFDAPLVERLLTLEDEWVRGQLLARLPAGTAFVAGAEVYRVRPGTDTIRRLNAVVLYDEEGRRSPAAAKRRLVPGAETMLGFERYAPVRDFAERLVGYLPDFVPAERTGVLSFRDRAGRRFRFGATVCFDNAFLGPYVEPLRREPLDFHLIVSNEAWYRTSFEMDQMVAFSRLIALSTGRAVVRATNSGVSVVLAPDGRELARVERAGVDRAVSGSLLARVPVPVDGAALTPYTRWGRGALLAAALVTLALALLGWLGGLRRGGRAGHGNSAGDRG